MRHRRPTRPFSHSVRWASAAKRCARARAATTPHATHQSALRRQRPAPLHTRHASRRVAHCAAPCAPPPPPPPSLPLAGARRAPRRVWQRRARRR
eukprot:2116740-Prymnesium_polylepis.1